MHPTFAEALSVPALTTHCKICSHDTLHSPDQAVLCSWKNGLTHLGCCIEQCSADKQGPATCPHAKGVFHYSQYLIHPDAAKPRL